jgi:hypothetical protein
MLFREITAVYSQNHMKPILVNTPCVQHAEVLNVKENGSLGFKGLKEACNKTSFLSEKNGCLLSSLILGFGKG